MNKLSVVLATHNEEKNIGDCLQSIKDIAYEIIIVDGRSSDRTVEIAKKFGALVFITENHPIFHINKQKALSRAKYNWILQLDADERVSSLLAKEIKKVIDLNDDDLEKHQQNLKQRKLFLRHQKILEKRDGAIGNNDGSFSAFFVPRLNYFLGKYLRFGGVYPDGVIRLVKKDKAHFPCKSVHEQIVIKGRVGWLENDLLHIDSPNFERYLHRNSRYIDLLVSEMKEVKLAKSIFNSFNYIIIKPIWWFLLTQIRHKGILDGWQGIVFSFFSALRFPRAYIRYMRLN